MKDLIRILYATLSVSILLAAHYPLSMAAQDKGMTDRAGQQKEMKENEVTVGLRAGHNDAFGGFAAMSEETYQTIRGGRGGWITEPFNIYYELNVHLLKKVEDWKMELIITNNEMFELERHYQPSFIARCCHYPTDRLGISFGIGCKPAGMFHMSADYYQTYIKTGVCYRW